MNYNFDIHHSIGVTSALNSQTIATDTDTNGAIIDIKDFRAIEFTVQSGTITDGAYTVKIQHGDDSGLSDAADVDAGEVLGSISFADTDDNAVGKIGYIGKKRYVRIVVTSTGTSSGGVFSGTAIKIGANHQPTDD